VPGYFIMHLVMRTDCKSSSVSDLEKIVAIIPGCMDETQRVNVKP